MSVRRGKRVGIDGSPVPLLRGRLHQFAAGPTAAAGLALIWYTDGFRPRLAIGVFTISVVAMLTASAIYHCHVHTPRARLWARRIDHGTIFVAIAGTQTAYWLLVGPNVVALPMLALVWGATAVAFRHKLRKLSTVDSTGNWLFGALGWSGVVLLPWLAGNGVVVLALVVLGGLAYTAGGIMLHNRWGNPWPGVVGHHEVWHALVLSGVMLHGTGIIRLSHTIS